MQHLRTSLYFNQQDWLTSARQQQRLIRDVTVLCQGRGIAIDETVVLMLAERVLNFSAPAAQLARLRHIEPDLIAGLQARSWMIHALAFAVRRDGGRSLAAPARAWVNPNAATIGARSVPSAAYIQLRAI